MLEEKKLSQKSHDTVPLKNMSAEVKAWPASMKLLTTVLVKFFSRPFFRNPETANFPFVPEHSFAGCIDCKSYYIFSLLLYSKYFCLTHTHIFAGCNFSRDFFYAPLPIFLTGF